MAAVSLFWVRRVATAATPHPTLSRAKRLSAKIDIKAGLSKRDIYWADLKKAAPSPVYDGALLVPGNRVVGCAVIETTDTTVVVHPRRSLEVDAFGNFEIQM